MTAAEYHVGFYEGDPPHDHACLVVTRLLPGGVIAVERADVSPAAAGARGRTFTARGDDPDACAEACRRAARGGLP